FYVGRDTYDTDSVLGGGDGASGMRAVAVVVVPGSGRRVGSAADARDAICKIDVGRQVRVRVVQTRIDIANGNTRVPAVDRASGRCANLVHVPLQARKVIATWGRCINQRGCRVSPRVDNQPAGEITGGRNTSHTTVTSQCGAEAGAIGT